MLYKVVLTFESVDEILKCDHSNESYWAVLSCGTVYYAVQGGFNFWVCGWNPKVWPFKWKVLSSTFLWYWVFIMLYKVVLTFESEDDILKCDHSNESYWAVLSLVLRIMLYKVVLTSLLYSQTCPSVRIITPWHKHLIKKNFQSSSDWLKTIF